MNRARRRLDPDELADLEDQRGYLLRSLRDLEREHEAGDVDDVDYRALRDDYTKRAADVLRAVESREAAIRTAAPPTSWRRRALTTVVLLAVAASAGLLLARAVGFRSSGDTLTGDIRTSTRTLLLEAAEQAGAGRLDEAISTYDEVLALQPSNAEALAYKGWYLYLSGDLGAARPLLDDAVSADAGFPDARVFRAIVQNDLGLFDGAATDLAAFAAGDPPPAMAELIEASLLRERVLAGQLAQADDPAPLLAEAVAADSAVAARAGRIVLAGGDVELAIRVFDEVLAADPDDLDALLGRGQLLVATGELAEEGFASLDRAVELAPEDPEVRLLRAESLVTAGDAFAARVELDRFDELGAGADLVARADALRASLG